MNRGLFVEARIGRKAVWGGKVGRLARLLAVLGLTGLSASCGDLTRQGTGSSYLIIVSLEAASGAEPEEFGGTLNSDVITIVGDAPPIATIFNDVARVRFILAMKNADCGCEGPTGPTTNNFITINRYRVRFTRSDGRNTPGVDVPFAFDGAFTATVTTAETTAGFELVRHVAKEEAPLRALTQSPVIISTIAEITFFGRDQTGREVSVSGQMLVSFGNFGDPD